MYDIKYATNDSYPSKMRTRDLIQLLIKLVKRILLRCVFISNSRRFSLSSSVMTIVKSPSYFAFDFSC
jgi:hypothetical protein